MPLFKKKPASAPSAATNQTTARQAVGQSREARTMAIGTELLSQARAHKSGLFSARFYSDKLMDWSMKDQAFKVQLFRFVDVFPMLSTPEQVYEHLADYLSQPGVSAPPGMDLGLRAGGLAKGLMAKTISGQIRGMAQKFIAGTDAASALPRLTELWKDGIGFSVDLLGEACLSDAEADEYAQKYLDLVTNLPAAVGGWAGNPRLDTDHLGPIPRCNVSIKISSLSSRTDPIDPEGSIRSLRSRLDPILRAAGQHGVFINFDMEQFALKDLTIELFKRCAADHPGHLGIAIQAYLKSGDQDARDLCDWARASGRQVTVRLIKGAYWDSETIHAEQMGWPCPVWNEKWQTDACFERMADVFLDAAPRAPTQGGVKLALGSHNARSIAHALSGLEARGLPAGAIELQMLHGMADQLKHAAAERGLRVREYVPVGELIPGMAYLVRRLLENTSNESWLKAGFLDNADPAALLANPAAQQQGTSRPDLAELAPQRHALSPAIDGLGDGKPFFNEPFRNFAVAAQREAFAKAVARVKLRPPPPDAGPDEADRALARAESAAETWRDFDPVERAAVLVKAANAMRHFRDELAAEIIAESGKPWREADADVCEAIDFCDYYARCAPRLFARTRLGRFIGELDETIYQPRGVAVVISPWNFPLAICCGMASAALVTGNTVILKPAEQSPRIAHRLVDILRESLLQVGAPQDAVQLLTGPGETVGAALVRDPRTALVAFTGSKAVGLSIIAAAAQTPEGQHHLKKVIAEMGGKNAIIVDTSADLDEAVVGVRSSSFGFSGQKCSACSRCIVVDPEGPQGPHITRFSHRLVEASRALVLTSPTSPSCDVGPVIDDEAAAKIHAMIRAGLDDGATLLLSDKDFGSTASGVFSGTGVPPVTPPVIPQHIIPPHIFTNVQPSHRIARDEIFGPVLAIMHARDFDEALRLANDHPYKLTGGLYSRMPAHIEQAKRRFRVGNLYINRGCTGALVARHPFGGFGLSGTGSKAGGADYLLHFVEPRAIAENTMRRGFAPEL